MIDIHCHILPAIDDGPDDLQTALEMFRIAEGDGITQIIATPHYRHGGSPTAQDIQEKIQQVRGELDKRGLAVKLLGGADIRLTYELLEGMAKREIPTINSSRYFLLELPDLIPPNLDNFLFEIRVRGYVPVITHPERNYSLLAAPQKIEPLRSAGALFQITAMSVTGKLGKQIKKFTDHLLKKYYVDFIATDAHNIERRPPVLSKAYEETSRIMSKHEADRIFLENPQAVIKNTEMPV